MSRKSRYSSGYCIEEELYVDDQGCFNCENQGCECCPMYISNTMAQSEVRRRMKSRKEDAEIRGEEPVWCIYWKFRKRHKRRQGR